ncbi:MAG: DUF58 domain-containing protein [Rhodocyclaceae bacterium]
MRLPALRARARRWMQRVPGPEAQPIRLPQSRIYVLPSRAGLAMLVTLLIMLVASINYALALGHALVFLLGGVGLAHILQSWRALMGLEISLRAEGEAYAGEATTFLVRLVDNAGRARPGVTLLAADGQRLTLGDVPAGSVLETAIRIPAPRRGWLWPGRLTVESRQPLGWVRAWSYIEPDARALVYPQPIGELTQPPTPGWAEGGQAALRGEEDFSGLREYLPQDSPSRIAWKRMATSGELLVKDFAGHATPDRDIDWHTLPGHWPVEQRLSQLALWVIQARQDGARTRLTLPGARIGPAAGEAHARDCLEALALFGQERP